MKLIKPYYEIITPIHGEEILKQIELAARTCYKSEGRIEYEEDSYTDGVHQVIIGQFLKNAKSAKKLIKNVLMSKGHNAMLEFGGMITVKCITDRGISHELVRHRLCSFAQESTRFCNYSDDKFGNNLTFIIPNWSSLCEGTLNVTNRGILHSDYWSELTCDGIDFDDPACLNYLEALIQAEESYFNLLNKGWTPQQARSVLPNSLKTEINMSANIREWREIFKQRTSNAAHPQMQELMRPLLKEFQEKIPILFDDITY